MVSKPKRRDDNLDLTLEVVGPLARIVINALRLKMICYSNEVRQT